MRRFGRPDKQTAGLQGGRNVAQVLRGNGAKRNDLAKPQPEPPPGGERIQSCYATFFLAATQSPFAMDGKWRRIYSYNIFSPKAPPPLF
jgi:hypothetical protein